MASSLMTYAEQRAFGVVLIAGALLFAAAAWVWLVCRPRSKRGRR